MSSDPKKVVNLERPRDGSPDSVRALSHEPHKPGGESEDNLDRLVSDFLEQINTVTAGYEAHGKSKAEDLDLLLASLTDSEKTEVLRPDDQPRVEDTAAPETTDGAASTATPVSEVAAPKDAPSKAELSREIERTLEELEKLDRLPASIPTAPIAGSPVAAARATPATAAYAAAPAVPEAVQTSEPAAVYPVGASDLGHSEPSPIWSGASEGKVVSRRILFILLIVVLILTLAVTIYYLAAIAEPEASVPVEPPAVASEPQAAQPIPQSETAVAPTPDSSEANTAEVKQSTRDADSERTSRPERRSPARTPVSAPTKQSSTPEPASSAPQTPAFLLRPDATEPPPAQTPEVLIPPRREQPAALGTVSDPIEPFQGSSAAIPDPAQVAPVGQLQPRRSDIPASAITRPQSSAAGSAARTPTPAVVISRVLPSFPEVARRVGLTGKVDLEIEIDEQGRVTRATPLSGPEVFHSAAINAVRRWRFKPATMNGINVSSQGRVSVLFDNPR